MEPPTGTPGHESPTESPNPYAPPVEAGGAPFGYGGTPRSLPMEMLGIVPQLAWWMRFLSVAYYIGVGLMVLVVVGLLAVGHGLPGLAQEALLAIVLMFGVFAVVGVLAAIWLMQAAHHFNSGVREDDMGRLLHGFRSLKLYLIVYVIWASISLLGQLAPFVFLGAAG